MHSSGFGDKASRIPLGLGHCRDVLASTRSFANDQCSAITVQIDDHCEFVYPLVSGLSDPTTTKLPTIPSAV